ncbi:HI1450 family dsDNA-mimic protein [Morganella morganii subsp. sibonii]|uniref:HI1450 family dsDNA-mimic protein n=1 Tax=Morganella morganii TaxID=582 RepID=UPI00069A24D9|nr:HI1450 family dsDNA-mimic protein [Morganella morganii]KNZ85142.1 hypothetical protein AKG16_16680 [Morganella morganii]MBS9540867.1 DUF440 family protein [Morganella morganii subsp. morganii]MDF2405261.1 DUF440 family protein [Morganella morganii]HCR4030617.1 DUF440 family protein [Morganella morganii]HCT4931115.1 DUF440 family protein [Morganella morganii]
MSTSQPRLLSEQETIEMAYDLFLEQAMDNLDPADVLLFNLQFEEIGGAEIVPAGNDWSEFAPFLAQNPACAEVIIGLAPDENADIDQIFARVLISRHFTGSPEYAVRWRE